MRILKDIKEYTKDIKFEIEGKHYICINCGNKIDDLFKHFGGLTLKLTKCVRQKFQQCFSVSKNYFCRKIVI